MTAAEPAKTRHGDQNGLGPSNDTDPTLSGRSGRRGSITGHPGRAPAEQLPAEHELTGSDYATSHNAAFPASLSGLSNYPKQAQPLVQPFDFDPEDGEENDDTLESW